MDYLTWGRNPWGESVLTRVSWDLLWARSFAGVFVPVAHAGYMLLSPHRDGRGNRSAGGHHQAAAGAHRPAFDGRAAFHWVMAAAMFVLLFTAFLPVVGVKFPWVTIHWIAGIVLTISVVFHLVHATFWLDFWSIWPGPKDFRSSRRSFCAARDDARRRGSPPSIRWRTVISRRIMLTGFAIMYRPLHDGAGADAILAAQPLSFQRHLGAHVRVARSGRHRARRTDHGARVLRHQAGEALDHQVDDLRLDWRRVSGTSRSRALGDSVKSVIATVRRQEPPALQAGG